MMQVTMNEISGKMAEVISQVEKGESCVIVKEGKPIAEILPLKSKSQGWKRTLKKIKPAGGITAQAYIENERNLS